MGNESSQEHAINKGLGAFMESIMEMGKKAESVLSHLSPSGPAKNVTITVSNPRIKVIRKGFFGIGRKVEIDLQGKDYKVTAYISMNNILCFDFKDKDEMKKYFENLK